VSHEHLMALDKLLPAGPGDSTLGAGPCDTVKLSTLELSEEALGAYGDIFCTL
jgi:hypothetical protein